ncbi:MAG: hypothetical protein ACFB03_10370 [Paracoccaceae bacterium]
MTFSAVAQAEPTRLNGSTGQRVKVGNVPDDDRILLSEFGKVSNGSFFRRRCEPNVIRHGRAHRSHIATVPYRTKPGTFYCDPFSLCYGSEMLGLFNIFGRAEGLKALDQALREFDVRLAVTNSASHKGPVKFCRAFNDLAGGPDLRRRC